MRIDFQALGSSASGSVQRTGKWDGCDRGVLNRGIKRAKIIRRRGHLTGKHEKMCVHVTEHHVLWVCVGMCACSS